MEIPGEFDLAKKIIRRPELQETGPVDLFKKYQIRYKAVVLLTMFFCPVLLHAQGMQDVHTLKSTMRSGMKNDDAIYFIKRDTLYSSRSNQNMKIALADINFDGSELMLTSDVASDTKTVYAIVLRPKEGKTAYKSLGLIALYRGESRKDPDTRTMYVYVAGKEEASAEYERFKSLVPKGN